MQPYHSTALSAAATKEAALYFDHVIPLFAVGEGMIGGGTESPWPYAFTHELLPRELLHDRFTKPFIDLQHKGLRVNYAMVHEGKDPENDPDFRRECESIALGWAELMNTYGLVDAPIVAQQSVSTTSTENATADIGITLTNLKLVDISHVSFEHLAELRRDARTRSALRRLRLFAFENYSGKPRSFVEDDLLQRIEDYQRAAAVSGLELRVGALSTLLNSKMIAGGLGSSVVAVLCGEPVVAVASATVAAVIELGRIAIEIAHKRFVHRETLSTNPVSYVSIVCESLPKAENE
jgi:hypothetical protein